MEQENREQINVAFVVYESAQSRMERANKRLVFAVVLSIVLLFLTNALWLWAWMQYDYVSTGTETNVDVDAKAGIANYIGNDGEIINGTNKSEDKNHDEKENP